jgi:hypothetical protein
MSPRSLTSDVAAPGSRAAARAFANRVVSAAIYLATGHADVTFGAHRRFLAPFLAQSARTPR